MTPHDQHETLYATLTLRYALDWPAEALLAIGHSYALAYGELPSEGSFVPTWAMPSRNVFRRHYGLSTGDYRLALLAAYPHLAGLDEWGRDCLRPWVTVECPWCGQPYQTRNATKWRRHPLCRLWEAEEDATWMNARDAGEVRDYGDLMTLEQTATMTQRRGKVGRPRR